MKKTAIFCLLQFCILSYSSILFSQVENVIVEKYYVSDANDFTDTSGGILPIGSTTYRIYIDLAPGSILKKIYGDPSHPFEITSTEVFFNNILDGKSFGKDITKVSLSENTVALDSWLTLGQVVKKQGAKTYYGILKNQDDDGSFIGGINNDGGSSLISTGLLVNNDPSCGIPLTTSDGMDTMSLTPVSWFDAGVVDFTSGNDSTIFGSIVPEKEFISTGFTLSNSGVTGINLDSNQIIIAQLTTKGDLSFKINLELEQILNGVPTLVKYVAKDTLLVTGEIFSPFLSYPTSCGCDDPDFLEYSSSYVCYLEGSCQTPIKIGCMDSMACNYDPAVNINVEELCCYPGFCADRNIEEVCPSLMGNDFDVNLYPNPTSGDITMNLISGIACNWNYEVYNTYGSVKLSGSFTTTDSELNVVLPLDLSNIDLGMYRLKVSNGDLSKHKLFIKN
ncbi:MAG: T9SS C-terminal target domain-containing protein [Flavobacteriales bacterium]|nr:T9SS C-terminal target domain-containing protein [Flavobacteriales bacterium]